MKLLLLILCISVSHAQFMKKEVCKDGKVENRKSKYGDEQCTCENNEWDCKLLGCRKYDSKLLKTVFVKPGEKFGKNCVCVEGSYPWMAPGSTLYYLKCKE
jgi:hypothetical protein